MWLILLAGVFTLVGSYVQWDAYGIVGERLIANIRTETFQKYLSMDVGFFDSPLHISSILVSRLSIDARRVFDMIDRLGNIVENYVLIAATLALCFSPLGDWRLSTLAVLLSPFCIFTVYMQNNFLFRITEQVDSELVKRSGDLTDYMLNIHTVHAYTWRTRWTRDWRAIFALPTSSQSDAFGERRWVTVSRSSCRASTKWWYCSSVS